MQASPDRRMVAQRFLLLGGYSWWSKRWVIWTIKWRADRQSVAFANMTLAYD